MRCNNNSGDCMKKQKNQIELKIVVCCPSYKRAKVETLKYIPFCKVYVDESEYKEYCRCNDGAEIVKCKKGIQGNIARVRNYIIDTEFKNGADVVCIVDDDMREIMYWEQNTIHRLKTENIMSFIFKYSVLASDMGCYLWGLNVNSDKQCYREYSPFSTVSPVLAPFSCHIRGSEIRYDENIPLKEDYDFFIQHMNKYRKVLRVNKYYYNVRQSEQAGGCAVLRNIEEEEEELHLLQKKWGSKIVKIDKQDRSNKSSKKKALDYNPIIKVPIKGI